MKKFVISSVAAFALVAAFSAVDTANAAVTASEIYTANSGYINLYSGYASKGKAAQQSNVIAAQKALNACTGSNLVLDGMYGPLTQNAFRAFQASKGVAVDGVIGPVTAAALAACSGDTNNNTGNLPVGCTATSAFSSITGEKCEVKDGALTSTEEADLDYTLVSESSITTDSKGQHAFTIEVEADRNGGDAKIERLDLVLDSDDTLYRAISAITLEVDGKEVASVDTDTRSDWRGDRDTVRFSNLNIIAKSGQTVEIEVLLDLTDKAVEDITLVKVDYRHTDGTGLVISDDEAGPVVATVDSIEDLGIKFSKNSKSPKDTTLDVSSAVNNQVLVITNAEVNKGIDGVLETATVEITLDGAASSATAVKELFNRFAFNIDGKQVDTINASAVTTVSTDIAYISGDVLTLEFDLDEFEVSEGDDFEFSVLANFRSYDAGTITKVKVGQVAFDGYDESKDVAMNTATSSNSHAAEFTITEGDVDVVINEVEEQFTEDRKGQIVFEVTVENNTGANLDNMETVGEAGWVFDVKGYGTSGTQTVEWLEGDALVNTDELEDGKEATFTVSLEFASTSTADFSIEVKSIDGINVGYVWTK